MMNLKYKNFEKDNIISANPKIVKEDIQESIRYLSYNEARLLECLV